MANLLANPLDELKGPKGQAPAWIWKVAASGAGILGGLLARKLLDRVRSRVSTKGDVPLNPGDERMTWPYALAWAGAVGVAAALGRLIAQRVVAAAYTITEDRPASSMPGPGS
jgi:hypothetical protein